MVKLGITFEPYLNLERADLIPYEGRLRGTTNLLRMCMCFFEGRSAGRQETETQVGSGC